MSTKARFIIAKTLLLVLFIEQAAGQVCKDYTANFGAWNEVSGVLASTFKGINEWVSETNEDTRLTSMKWCKQNNNQHFRGFTGTWTLGNGATESHTWGQVIDFEDDLCYTINFPDEIMFGQLYTDTNDIEGMVFWDYKNIAYTMRADGNSPSPKFQFGGRPIGFKVWEGRGGVLSSANPRDWNIEGPLEISFITNACNCPASTFMSETAPPYDMSFQFYVDSGTKTQTLPFYDNYMRFVYGQNCGSYLVRTTPSYSWLTVNTAGTSYPNQLRLTVTDLADVGVYPIDVEIYQDTTVAGKHWTTPRLGTMPSIIYPITVEIICKVTSAIIVPVNRVVYNIYTPAITINYSPMIQNPDCQFPWNCVQQIENPDHGTRTPLPSWITHSGSTFTIQTDDPTTELIWNLSILCTIPLANQSPQFEAEQIIVLDVENGCLGDVLTPNTAYADVTRANNNAYYIDYKGTLTYQPRWSQLVTGCPTTLHIFRVIDGVDTPLTAHELAVMTWDDTVKETPQLTVDTSDFNYHGELWTIKIYLESTHSQVIGGQGVFEWDIEFYDRCWDHNLVAPVVYNRIYDLWQDQQLTFIQMNDLQKPNYFDCAGATHELIYDSGDLWDPVTNTGPDLAIYTLSTCLFQQYSLNTCSFDGAFNLGLDLADVAGVNLLKWVGTHYFKIKGTLGVYDAGNIRGVDRLYHSVTSNVFRVTIINPCLISQVNGDGAIALRNHYNTVLSGVKDQQSFEGPTDSASVLRGTDHNRCGRLNYIVTDNTGTQIWKPFLQVTHNRRRPHYADKFTINCQSDEREDVGIHDFQLRINLPDYPSSTQAILPFSCQIDQCVLVDFAAPTVDDQVYRITENRLTVNFEFVQDPCDYVQTLTLKHYDDVTGNEVAIPNFIAFSSSMGTMGVYTTNNDDAGEYLFEVTCTLDDDTDPDKQSTLSVQFWLTVVETAERVPANNDPYFLTTIEDKCFHVGHAFSYTLGPAFDENQHTAKVTVDLGDAKRFMQWRQNDNQFLVLERSTFPSDIGRYFIKGTITDDSDTDPADVKFNFTICITPDPNDYPGEPPQYFQDSRRWPEVMEFEQGEYHPEQPVPHIVSLSNTGVVTIGWDKKMQPPGNYTIIPEEEVAVRFLERRKEWFYFPPDQYEELIVVPGLELDVDLGLESNETQLIFDWDVLGFNEDYLYVQLHFNTPSCVSQHELTDFLNITFWHPDNFRSQEGYSVRHGTRLEQEITRQIDPEQAQNYGAFGSILDILIKLFCTTFLFLVLLYGVSIVPLWAFLNTLQLILHIPLMNVKIPANVAFFFGRLYDLGRLSIFPVTQYVQSKWGYNEERAHHILFEEYGLPYRYVIANCAFILIVGALIGLVWGILALKDMYVHFRIKKGFKVKNTFLLYKHEPWMCNFAVRFAYEAFLEVCICVFINMAYLNFGDEPRKGYSSFVAICLLIGIIGFLVLLQALFWKNYHLINVSGDAQSKLKELEQLKRDEFELKQKALNDESLMNASQVGLIPVGNTYTMDDTYKPNIPVTPQADDIEAKEVQKFDSGRKLGLRQAAINYQKAREEAGLAEPINQAAIEGAIDENRLADFDDAHVNEILKPEDYGFVPPPEAEDGSSESLKFNVSLYNQKRLDLFEGGAPEGHTDEIKRQGTNSSLPSIKEEAELSTPGERTIDPNQADFDKQSEGSHKQITIKHMELKLDDLAFDDPPKDSLSQKDFEKLELQRGEMLRRASKSEFDSQDDSEPKIPHIRASQMTPSKTEDNSDPYINTQTNLNHFDQVDGHQKQQDEFNKMKAKAMESFTAKMSRADEPTDPKSQQQQEYKEILDDYKQEQERLYQEALDKVRMRNLLLSGYEPVPRFRTLFLGLILHHRNKAELVHPLMFIARRLIFALLLVFLISYPLLQIWLFLGCSFAMLVLLYGFRQWSYYWDHRIQVFNEWAVYLGGIFCLLFFWGLFECDAADNLGNCFIVLLLVVCLVNMLYMAYVTYQRLKLLAMQTHLTKRLRFQILKSRRKTHEVNPDNIYVGNQGQTLTRQREKDHIKKMQELAAKAPTNMRIQTTDPRKGKTFVSTSTDCKLIDELKEQVVNKQSRIEQELKDRELKKQTHQLVFDTIPVNQKDGPGATQSGWDQSTQHNVPVKNTEEEEELHTFGAEEKEENGLTFDVIIKAGETLPDNEKSAAPTHTAYKSQETLEGSQIDTIAHITEASVDQDAMKFDEHFNKEATMEQSTLVKKYKNQKVDIYQGSFTMKEGQDGFQPEKKLQSSRTNKSNLASTGQHILGNTSSVQLLRNSRTKTEVNLRKSHEGLNAQTLKQNYELNQQSDTEGSVFDINKGHQSDVDNAQVAYGNDTLHMRQNANISGLLYKNKTDSLRSSREQNESDVAREDANHDNKQDRWDIERELAKAEHYLLNDPETDYHLQLAKNL